MKWRLAYFLLNHSVHSQHTTTTKSNISEQNKTKTKQKIKQLPMRTLHQYFWSLDQSKPLNQ